MSYRQHAGTPLLVLSRSRYYNEVLYARDAATGAELWELPVPGAKRMLAVGGERVYVLFGGGALASVDPTVGRQNWRASLPIDLDQELDQIQEIGEIVLATFKTSSGIQLFALERTNGAIRWQDRALSVLVPR